MASAVGFKDTAWAYSLDLPMAQKVVLAAVCHRTDDKTHQTFVGQGTIAEMTGSGESTVRRALRGLEESGHIVREARHGNRGYRTSDLLTVQVTRLPVTASGGDDVLPVTAAGRDAESYRSERATLPVRASNPTARSDRAEEINQKINQGSGETLAPWCSKHPGGTDARCGACGAARRAFDAAKPSAPETPEERRVRLDALGRDVRVARAYKLVSPDWDERAALPTDVVSKLAEIRRERVGA